MPQHLADHLWVNPCEEQHRRRRVTHVVRPDVGHSRRLDDPRERLTAEVALMDRPTRPGAEDEIMISPEFTGFHTLRELLPAISRRETVSFSALRSTAYV